MLLLLLLLLLLLVGYTDIGQVSVPQFSAV